MQSLIFVIQDSQPTKAVTIPSDLASQYLFTIISKLQVQSKKKALDELTVGIVRLVAAEVLAANEAIREQVCGIVYVFNCQYLMGLGQEGLGGHLHSQQDDHARFIHCSKCLNGWIRFAAS